MLFHGISCHAAYVPEPLHENSAGICGRWTHVGGSRRTGQIQTRNTAAVIPSTEDQDDSGLPVLPELLTTTSSQRQAHHAGRSRRLSQARSALLQLLVAARAGYPGMSLCARHEPLLLLLAS